ncbi:acetyl esterase/lipase [Sphingobium sp. OAS761]|uniref:alpha/beta hydrolase n=1 Tax=Sphingobium sp. OAS761 TaxID=2817901 RepID=UPI0020A09393|nr:alpha/beta hydrolase [Sphingobium sp. OAS761]MCP1470301.1 acetyl esterase/lipase [Sphingobium sp. OAS761]
MLRLSDISRLRHYRPARKHRRPVLAMCAAIFLMGAAPVSVPDDQAILATVNSELRPMARILLNAQRLERSFKPSRPARPPDGVSEVEVPGMGKAPPVTLYIVNRSAALTPPRGAILYIHGGGFVAGDARDDLRELLPLARRLDCLIVSVQYRLAPATPFPGALEDNYAALKWLHAHAGELGVDPARLVVMGESAGGGHAAMLTIAARARKEVPIAFQALVYPMLDDRTGSARTVPPHAGRLIWTAESNRAGWQALLGRKPGRSDEPRGAVPAREKDLTGLPPTFIGVGSIDLFANEDIEFARRLVDAGVPTELLVIPGAFHGFQRAVPRAAVSQQFNAALEAALARVLKPGG